MPRVAPQKLEWIQWRSNAGTLAGGFFRSKAGQLCPHPERGGGDRTVVPLHDCGWVRRGVSGGMDVAHPQPRALGESAASPRDRLIEAATRLFCRYGVNSVGVDEIIAAAGTAKTTLYRLVRPKGGVGQGGAVRGWGAPRARVFLRD